MSDALVSVVIPVYKTEKYLDRCVESIINQTYKNLEIILVDDGSPDDCPRLCDQWASRDGRIKVIHKVNEGLGRARNSGIDQATGDYICFVDSDDYIELFTIERACAVATRQDADMVCFGMQVVGPEGKTLAVEIPHPPKDQYIGEEVQKDFLPKLIGPDPGTGAEYGLSMSGCTRLISMRSIRKRNWRFVSEREISPEDYYSVIALCADLESVYILPLACYNYYRNTASISRSYQPNRFGRVCHFYGALKKLCQTLDYPREVTECISGIYLSLVIAALKHEAAFGGDSKVKRVTIRGILNNEELQKALRERKNDKLPIKKKLLFWAMRNRLTILCHAMLTAQNRMT